MAEKVKNILIEREAFNNFLKVWESEIHSNQMNEAFKHMMQHAEQVI